MAEYLSPEWLAEMRAAAEHARPTADTPQTPDLVIQHRFTDRNDADYHVTTRAGAVRVETGLHPDPDVRFSSTTVVATAIASGRVSAQSAFMAGDLSVGGNLTTLTDRRANLDHLDDVFAPVRSRTTYPPV